jgi:imidazolonepropionase-like amidohydrolase
MNWEGAEMKQTINTIVAILTGLLAITLCANGTEIPGKPQEHPIVLRGGTVHTVSGEVIPSGMVLFDKGKIVAIGSSVSLPPDAEVIDVAGKHVYPGLIDANSALGLTEIGSVRATVDVAETGPINPNARAEVAVNPESELIPVSRANGITVAVSMPQGGVISGTSAAIELDGWTWVDMTMKAPLGLVVNWPQLTINRAWWEQRSEEDQKKEREKGLEDLKNAFRDARAYMQAKKAGSRGLQTDLRWEAMIPALEGKIPVMVNAEEIQQIQSAVAWAKRENLKIVLVGGYDAWRVASLLKEGDVPVIVNPIHRTPWREWDAYDEPFSLPAKLYAAGVRFCIAGDGDASNERNVPYHAATAAAYGLPKEEALKAITLNAAKILGLQDRLGSIEPGKDATLIVTTGDPLEITSNVEMEFIRGKKIPLTSRHTRLYEKYREKYQRLKGSK